MQEIAAATNNFQDFNEIMPCIFRNFMEREAREWRQIYKVRETSSGLSVAAADLNLSARPSSHFNC